MLDIFMVIFLDTNIFMVILNKTKVFVEIFYQITFNLKVTFKLKNKNFVKQL